MQTKLVRIGNSRGVRIPRPLLQQAGLHDGAELRHIDPGIIIERAAQPRTGGAAVAEALAARGEDTLHETVYRG